MPSTGSGSLLVPEIVLLAAALLRASPLLSRSGFIVFREVSDGVPVVGVGGKVPRGSSVEICLGSGPSFVDIGGLLNWESVTEKGSPLHCVCHSFLLRVCQDLSLGSCVSYSLTVMTV